MLVIFVTLDLACTGWQGNQPKDTTGSWHPLKRERGAGIGGFQSSGKRELLMLF